MNPRHTPTRRPRKPVLSSISLAVVATLIASGAHAAETAITFNGNSGPTTTATGINPLVSNLLNNAPVTSVIEAGAVRNGVLVNSAGGQINAAQAADNAIAASSTGNKFENKLGLALTGNATTVDGTNTSEAGSAALGFSVNGGAISSAVRANTVSVDANSVSGSIANTGNRISATAIANDGVSSITGEVPNGYISPTAGSASTAAPLSFNAAGSIVLSSGQLTTGTVSATAGPGIESGSLGQSNAITLDLTAAGVGVGADTTGSGAALSRNAIAAGATGNRSANTIDLDSATPSVTGSAVLNNTQIGLGASAAASNTNSVVRASVTGTVNNVNTLTGSALTVQDNSLSSAAQGNEASNRIVLSDGMSFVGAAAADAAPGARLAGFAAPTAVNADLLILNSQGKLGGAVTSSTSNASVSAQVEALADSAVTLSGNGISASAAGNTAASSLVNGASAASFNSSAALASQQGNLGGGVSATNDNAKITATVNQVTGTVVTGEASKSRVSVAGNSSSADARGNEVSQRLALDATTLTLGSSAGGTVALSGAASSVTAAGAATVSNLQLNEAAPVTALNRSSSIGQTAGNVTGAALSVGGSTLESNIQQAVALGNNAANMLELSGNTVGTGAGIVSDQRVDASSAVSATLSGARTFLNAGSVTDSALSVSDNQQSAIGYGNSAVNALSVKATNVAQPGGNMSAGFGILNQQTSNAAITATQRDSAGNLAPSDVRITVSGAVADSAVSANRNSSLAEAVSNNADNVLSLDVGSNLAAISSVQNSQTASGGVSALIGKAGTPGIAGTVDTDYPGVGSSATAPQGDANFSSGNSTLTVAAGKTVVFSTSGAGTDKAALEAHLTSLGFDVDSTAGTATAAGGAIGKDFVLSSLTSAGGVNSGTNTTFSFSGFSVLGTPAVAAIPNLGGVTVTVTGPTIAGSRLSVSNNTTAAVAEGNRASNRLPVAGNTVASLNGLAAAAINDDNGLNTVADHAVFNSQSVTGAPIVSEVFGTFAIDAQPGAAISKSSLSVSNNRQSASAAGNTAISSLDQTGTGLTAVSALQSVQSSSAPVRALSSLELFAPGAVTGSSVALSANSNEARAVLNNAANTLTVSGTGVGNGTGTGQAGSIVHTAAFLDGNELPIPAFTSVTAEQLLANRQTASNTVTATATTSLYNQQRASLNSLDDSSLTVSGNSTLAVALANQAANTATVSGDARQSASIAVSNRQDSSAVVTATATTSGRVGLASALNGSNVLVSGNSTTALAAGNYADNALNSVAGSAYGVAAGATVALADASSVNANASILNRQTNSGAVSATSTGASYQVALNSATDVSNGRFGVLGNSVVAEAYGNSATNLMTLNALNTAAPTSAVGNYQVNSGAVSATVNGVTFGAGITGIAGATVRTNGNQITATAVGNSVVSSALAR